MKNNIIKIEKWAKYLNEAKANELPKRFEFVKSNVSEEDYDKILELANKNEVSKE